MASDRRPKSVLDLLCRHAAADKLYSVQGTDANGSLEPLGVDDDDFRWGVVDIPELRPLTSLFDVVLVRSGSQFLDVILVVEPAPGVRIDQIVPVERLKEIGNSYQRRIEESKKLQSVSFKVWALADPGDVNTDAYLYWYSRAFFSFGVGVSYWEFNTGTGEIRTNARLGGIFGGLKFANKAFALSLAGTPPDTGDPIDYGADYKFPLVTFGMIAALLLTFLLQPMLFGYGGDSEATTRAVFVNGGLSKYHILVRHQWYRILSGGVLHRDFQHFFFNAVGLFLAGVALESLVGRRWFLASFVICMIFGGLASLIFLHPLGTSIGASGAITGMLVAGVVVLTKLKNSFVMFQLQLYILYNVLGPTLLSVGDDEAGRPIDHAAHYGGAVAGLVLGLFLLKTWRRDERLPRYNRAALAIGGAGAVMIWLSLAKVVAPVRMATAG